MCMTFGTGERRHAFLQLAARSWRLRRAPKKTPSPTELAVNKAAITCLLLWLCVTNAHAGAPASTVITGHDVLSSTCSGHAGVVVHLQTTNNGAPDPHINFSITAPGFAGYTWMGDTAPAAGAPVGWGLGYPAAWNLDTSPNTAVTATVYTYASATLSNPVYSSSITWDCTTGVTQPVVNTDLTPSDGMCGSAAGTAASSAPSNNLCTAGTASAVTGDGPWNWSCSGAHGGQAAACTAPRFGTKTYSAPSPTGPGTITATLSGGGDTCGFAAGTRYIASEPAATPTTPPGVAFPHGLFDFSATQCSGGEGTSSITLEITYPQLLPAGTRYYKWGPTPTNSTPHWYEMPATITGNLAIFTIVDGELGDDDLQVNGTIVDQGGPGVGGGSTGVAAVPTLSEWALVLMASLLALAAVRGYRGRP